MPAAFAFAHHIEFSPETSTEILRRIPAAPGIFALRGASTPGQPDPEPYITRAADLRRRLRRLLAPPEALNPDGTPILSKRLNLRDRVRSIAWTRTGSEFESTLALYCATRAAFGPDEARRRMRLHAPYFLRVTATHEHPRVYSTNKLSRRALAETFGPFPSRAAADRYCDAVLDLFKLRRCYEDLAVHPDHPGCAYGEMNKCLAPCKTACTPSDYAAEAARVLAFFTTRGESMLNEVAAQREAASEAMDFEAAASLHKQWEKVRAAASLADELVRPIPDLRALILQESAPQETPAAQEPATPPGAPPSTTVSSSSKVGTTEARAEEAAVFLFDHGRITGPARLSTLGVRAVREQTAVGSSLFAQPLMLAAVPLNEAAQASPKPGGPSFAPLAKGGVSAGAASPFQTTDPTAPPADSPSSPDRTEAETRSATTFSPEDRARQTIATLEAQATSEPDLAEQADYLSLLRRWYYRPEKQRAGEVFLPNPDAASPETSWPLRRILNGAARVALGPPVLADAVNREAAREALKAVKTKVIHEGREGVERTVPVLPKRSRSRKSVPPAEGEDGSH